jgi:hypothetical protein
MTTTACVDGAGARQDHDAQGRICAPGPVPVGHMCATCAKITIDEYAAKWGQTWTFAPYPRVQQ